MRSLRFVILVALAAGFGTWAYLDSKKDLTDTSTTKKTKVFDNASGKIEEVQIHSATGTLTSLKKNGDNWQITAPEKADADSSEVSSLVTTLESLEEQRTIDEHPQQLSAFGVSPARISVAVKLTGDPATHQLDIGNKTAAGTDIYAAIEGQPKVFLISSYVEDSLNKSAFDLRDKTALKFSKDGADALTIEAPGSPAIVLAKKGCDWSLAKPVEAKADFGSVDAVVNRLAQAKMKSIVVPGSRPPVDTKDSKDTKKDPDKDPKAATDTTKKPAEASTAKPGDAFTNADFKAYGLDKPQVTATVGVGFARSTMQIGGKFDDTSVYARDMSRPQMVFTVEKGVLDDTKKKVDDLRVKDVFEFRAYTATSIDLTYGGATYSFEKQKSAAKDATQAPADVWRQTKPTAKDIDQTKFNDLLSNVSNLRADKFADKPLASGDDLMVSAKFGEAASPKQEQVMLRKSGTVVQAIHPGDTGPAIVPTADFDKIIGQVKELIGKK